MSTVLEHLAERIQRAISDAGGLDRLFAEWHFGIPNTSIRALINDSTYLDDAAARVEVDLVRYADAIVVEPRNRDAVIYRLLPDWPLASTVLPDVRGFESEEEEVESVMFPLSGGECTGEEQASFARIVDTMSKSMGKPVVPHFTGDSVIFVVDPIPHLLWRLGTPEKRWPFWPASVSAADLADALERTKDADALVVANLIRNPPPPNTTYKAAAYEQMLVVQQRWSRTRCALVVDAERKVEAGRRVPTVKVSAKPPSRTVVRMLSEGPATKNGTNWDRALTGKGRDGTFELVWKGKRDAFQLSLLPDMPLAPELVQSILRELGDDGVRDWFVFHVMAERQGGSGDFTWSWREHRAMAGYDRRTNKCDAELAAACVERIWALSHATLRIQRQRGNRVEWVRVGDHGLVDVPAGRDDLTEAGRLTTVARIRINKGIYQGARTGTRAPYYALLHERAMVLPPHEMRLAAMLAFDWRYAVDTGGNVTRKASTLWDYGRIFHGSFTKAKHWPRATNHLHRVLDNLATELELTWTVERTGPNATYTIAPPAWWKDRVLHAVPPVLPSSTAGAPRTGAELVAWRAAHHLSLRAAAVVLGVGKDVVQRAEQRPTVPLPASWVSALGSYRTPR